MSMNHKMQDFLLEEFGFHYGDPELGWYNDYEEDGLYIWHFEIDGEEFKMAYNHETGKVKNHE